MNPLDEEKSIEEMVATIEGTDTDDFEERYELSKEQRIILEASRTPFWNDFLIPELNTLIAVLDLQSTTEVDPWRRYATVEAYKVMTNFKLKLIDALETAQQFNG